MTSASKSRLPGDNPIKLSTEDKIGRAPRASSFASHLLRLDSRDGFVVGVLGPWGSGKTSFLNLVRNELTASEVPVLHFNPWMFSGAEQLVTAFFDEIADQAKVTKGIDDLGEPLEAYGDALSGMDWIPVAGSFLRAGGGLAKLLGNRLKKRERGVTGRRRKIEDALAKLVKPVFVVIDDVDRLTDEEIRDIFKLVRLTANFPNIVYLVAFDRTRVEQALTRDGFDGRAYLEKILQLSVDLPKVPAETIGRETFAAINAAVAHVEDAGPFDQGRWQDVYVEIIRPLIKTMRDVKRYGLAVSVNVSDLDGRVSFVDVLALEAVRLFLPDVFHRLNDARHALTNSGRGIGRDDSTQRQEIESIIQSAGVDASHQAVAKALLVRLFPFAERFISNMHYDSSRAGTWLKEKRVANIEVFNFYLERVAGDKLLAFYESEIVRGLMTDGAALERHLRNLPPDQLEPVISSLEAFEDDFKEDEIVPTTSTLFNIIYDIPERPRGMFELDARFVVRRVVYRLMRRFEEHQDGLRYVQESLSRIETLSGQLELISMAGHREKSGHKLISEAETKQIEREWRERVRTKGIADLEREPELLWVLSLLKSGAIASGEQDPEIEFTPSLTLAVLRSAVSESLSQGGANREIKRTPQLPWDSLQRVFGTEELLRRMATEAMSLIPEDDKLAVLVRKYLSGWRPNHFDEN